jgi:hypothetical protein
MFGVKTEMKYKIPLQIIKPWPRGLKKLFSIILQIIYGRRSPITVVSAILIHHPLGAHLLSGRGVQVTIIFMMLDYGWELKLVGSQL